jgi:heme oxygenase
MILKRLKLASSARHTALEDQLPLMKADLSREDYRRFVSRFFGFDAQLEVPLIASPHWLFPTLIERTATYDPQSA